jgi:prophage antirepressor-like protein
MSFSKMKVDQENNFLELFNYENNQVRTFTKDDGSIWFVGLDVCKILELKNTSQAFSRLKDDQKDEVILNDAIGRKQNFIIVSESGLNKLVLKSRKKEAEIFQDWICEKVLPAIRKTGSYSVNPEPIKIISPEELALLQAQNIFKLSQRTAAIESKVETLINEKDENIKKFFEVEKSGVLPFQETTKIKVKKLVFAFASASKVPYGLIYDRLYSEYKLRYRKDIKTLAKNRNISGLQMAEELMILDSLFDLASEILDISKFESTGN